MPARPAHHSPGPLAERAALAGGLLAFLFFVVILHLSPNFKILMPELLARHTGVPIHTATHATRLEGDTIYIIPPGKNMVVRDGQLLLHDQDRAPGHPLHLPIDIFLRSLAEQSASQTPSYSARLSSKRVGT